MGGGAQKCFKKAIRFVDWPDHVKVGSYGHTKRFFFAVFILCVVRFELCRKEQVMPVSPFVSLTIGTVVLIFFVLICCLCMGVTAGGVDEAVSG